MTENTMATEVAWRISSYSQSAGANCVEAGPVLDRTGLVAVRDSKRRQAGVLTAGRPSWRAFTSWAARRA